MPGDKDSPVSGGKPAFSLGECTSFYLSEINLKPTILQVYQTAIPEILTLLSLTVTSCFHSYVHNHMLENISIIACYNGTNN